jgi:dipeptidyl aminopeptidase/acylaminoacyl peptidase
MRLRSLLLCAAVAAAPVAVHAAAPLVPIDAFVEEPQYGQPRLSPDGKHIALNVRIERNGRTIPTMTVYALPALQVVSVIALPGFEIPVDFAWISNRRLIVEKGLEVGLRERPQATGEVVAVDLDGTRQEYLYGYKGFKQSSRGDRYGDDYGYGNVAHIPQSRDGHIFLGTHNWRGSHSLLYDINSNNSARKLLADIAMENMGFLFQNDDKARFSYGTDDDNHPVLFRLDDASGEWRRVDQKLLGGRFHPFAFTPDNSGVYAWHSTKGEPYAVVREDMQTGTRTMIVQDPLASIETIEFSARPRVPFAVTSATGIPKARYLDETAPDAALHKTLSALFPHEYVHFINFTDDGQKLLFSVRSDRDPGSYYLFDKHTAKAELLFANMQKIDPDQMAERQPVTFAARDGLAITGYLTLPKNPEKKKLPLVLLPHGGPFDVADDWYFDDDAQFLASRGYAVLQVNFRGSGGRGLRFKQAGYREWGGKIMNDLIDGVRATAARADIDADRVCVYGISFGGYAALMLPVREPSMFKCSVGFSGRYELASKYDQRGIKGETRGTNFLIRTMGDDPAMLAANSPARLAEQIKLPVFMVHGAKDKITDLAQAETMRDALIKAGRPPEWMLVKIEGHGFYDSGYRKEFYQRLESFLAKHIGPR